MTLSFIVLDEDSFSSHYDQFNSLCIYLGHGFAFILIRVHTEFITVLLLNKKNIFGTNVQNASLQNITVT